MKLVTPPNPNGLPYCEIDFAGGRRETRWISTEEKDKLAPESRDAHFDMTTGKWSVRTEN